MPGHSTERLLDIRGLNVVFPGDREDVHAVRDVSFSLGRERLAIVGESGSGKSTIMRALLGLLPSRARLSAEHAHYFGSDGALDLLRLGQAQLRKVRGRQIAMIVQDPKQGLNPVRRVGHQIEEMIRLHQPGTSSAELRARVLSLLGDVNIQEPQRVFHLLPHEVSGGMAQRIMIAMMLAGSPDILIADEATSALDVLVQHRILELIDRAASDRRMGLILISHDLDLVGHYADRILVMYRGRIVECLEGPDPLARATHPYTKGLLACRPRPHNIGRVLPVLNRDPAWLT
jgi:peptide/nickel transport system ATP-binding protein